MGSSWIIHIGFKSHIVAVVVQLLSHFCLFVTPMDCSPPGSSVHEISQARILEWVSISFSRRSSKPTSPTLQMDSLLLSHPKSPKPKDKRGSHREKKRKPPRQRRDWSKVVTRNIVATGKTMEDSFLEPPKIAQPSDTSISGFSLQDYERIHFCCSKPPCLW